ncbi:MAG: hypothetical protein L0229_02040 [Blastocatellia bacterium]|nr:hypothetical protein [Blastocatellia bacterium]
MPTLARATILIAAMFCAAASGQTQSETKEAKSGTASISGPITVGTDPAPGVVVAVTHDNHQIRQTPVAQATTDKDGRYKVKGLSAGRYIVSPIDPLLVLPQDAMMQGRGKSVSVSEGEEIEGIDFSLVRGGVITGRVTDDQGRPLVGEQVALSRVDERDRKTFVYLHHRPMLEIDDRGIYRLFGIPAGRYVVSVGRQLGSLGAGNEGGFYARTFHPGTTEESQAEIIEISSGEEATGIDIMVGPLSRSYTVTGRIVYAETGAPFPNALYGYGILSDDGKSIQSTTYSKRTDAGGNFRLGGVLPGRYVVFSVAESESDYYSEPVPFEIADEDVSGLEVRVHRGASLSGIAVIEGTNDTDILARISKLQFIVFQQEGGPSPPRSDPVKIELDGSFRTGALHPGKVRLYLMNHLPVRKGFHLIRVERGGVNVTDGIEIAPGEEISGLRAIIAYGTSRILGQLKMAEGELPKDVGFVVSAHLISSGVHRTVANVEADQKGRFVLEGLPAGEYRLLVRRGLSRPGFGRILPGKTFRQDVTVAEQAEVQVTITIDLNAGVK